LGKIAVAIIILFVTGIVKMHKIKESRFAQFVQKIGTMADIGRLDKFLLKYYNEKPERGRNR